MCVNYVGQRKWKSSIFETAFNCIRNMTSAYVYVIKDFENK